MPGLHLFMSPFSVREIGRTLLPDAALLVLLPGTLPRVASFSVREIGLPRAALLVPLPVTFLECCYLLSNDLTLTSVREA